MNTHRLAATAAALAVTLAPLSLSAISAGSAAAAVPTGPGGLSVGCVEKRQLAGPSYDVSLCGVVDVDQERKGLPGDGAMHCGPAALFDVLDWWATREDTKIGWFSTDLRDVDPADPADHTVTGNSIDLIAQHAGFDPADPGVAMPELLTAFGRATKPVRDAGGSTLAGYVSSTDPAFPNRLAADLSRGPLNLVYGRYTAGPQAQSLTRSNGGHIVTVVGARGNDNGTTITLDLADPGRAADDGVGSFLYHQSAYQRLTVTLTRTTINEFVVVPDNVDTPWDESQNGQNGSYRTFTRWVLTGPAYASSTTQVVEGFNWYRVIA